MKFVQPIRDKRKIDAIKRYLKDRNERDYLMFVLGINTGLRISDILSLRVSDVRRAYIDITERKTGKHKFIKINRTLRSVLDQYIRGLPDDAFLFRSRNRKRISREKGQPIDTSMAYKALRSAAQMFGVSDIGTHSMRKTFGYHSYRQNRDVALLMELFNHSHPSITLRYVGITQDNLDGAIDDLNL